MGIDKSIRPERKSLQQALKVFLYGDCRKDPADPMVVREIRPVEEKPSACFGNVTKSCFAIAGSRTTNVFTVKTN